MAIAMAKYLLLAIYHPQTAFATVIATANQPRRYKLPNAVATAIHGAVASRCNG